MREKLETLSLAKLKEFAKEQEIKGYGSMRKAELIDILCEKAGEKEGKSAPAVVSTGNEGPSANDVEPAKKAGEPVKREAEPAKEEKAPAPAQTQAAPANRGIRNEKKRTWFVPTARKERREPVITGRARVMPRREMTVRRETTARIGRSGVRRGTTVRRDRNSVRT